MPRPTTKQSLLKAAEEGFEKLFGFAEAMSEEERCAEFLFEDRDKKYSGRIRSSLRMASTVAELCGK